MKDRIFRKKRNVLNRVGAGIMSALILAGFTGCVDENGETDETTPYVSLDPSPNEPGDGEGANSGEAAKPSETTQPVVIIKPEETTKPSATTKPEETTPKPEEITPPEEPEPPVVLPPEDLPADEDGYQYPDIFADKVMEQIQGGKFQGKYFYNEIKDQRPEIVFVERGDEKGIDGLIRPGVVIYAKYKLKHGEINNVYIRMVFEITGSDAIKLGWENEYHSYAEYIDAVVKALENKCIYTTACVSEISDSQDYLNSIIGDGFAEFIDERFVDVQINCVQEMYDKEIGWYYGLYGFGYDADDKSYSFNIDVYLPFGYQIYQFIIDQNRGVVFEVEPEILSINVSAIDSVFTKPEEQPKDEE